MRALAVAAIILACLGWHGRSHAQTADMPVPACRLESPKASTVMLTATEALRRVKARHPIAAGRIVLNPTRRLPNELPLYIVSDAHADEVDERGCIKSRGPGGRGALDRISVRGICVASDGRIFCSAGAISAILDEGRKGAPFLLFLLAHELTHIALGHPGASMNGQTFAIDLSEPRRKRLSDLAAACLRDQEQIERETAADQGALEVISSAFIERPFATGSDRTQSLIENSEEVYQSYRRLLEWQASYYGSTSALVAPGRHSACEVLGNGSGRIELPELGGNHPHSWRRLAAIVMWTAKQAVLLGKNRASADFSAWQTNAMTDGMLACGNDVAVARFCKDVRRLAAGQLDCATAPAGSSLIELDDSDVASCGYKNDDADVIAIALPAPMAAAKAIERPAALFLKFHLLSLANATKEEARRVGGQAAADIGFFLSRLAVTLSAQGGYLIRHESSSVSISSNPFTGAFDATSEHRLIAMVPQSFNVDKVDGYEAVKAFRGTEATVVPWGDAKYMGILHFKSDPTDSKHDSKRLLTVNLPLDFFYDIAKAKSGQPEQIGPEFARLICYVRGRLSTRWPGAWTLEEADTPQWPFYLSGHGENWYFPRAWNDVATSGCRDNPPRDRQLRAFLARAYDYGDNSKEIPATVVDEVFAIP